MAADSLHNLDMSKQKGFTLSELVVGTAIGSIIMLTVASIFFFLNYTYLSKKDRLDAEDQAATAEYMLKLLFSQAVDVQGTVTGGATFASGGIVNPVVGTVGQVVGNIQGGPNIATFDQIVAPQWIKIAAFLRENQASTSAGPTHGLLARTAIWFRRPEAAAAPNNTSGVMFFDIGTRLAPNAAPAAAAMQPDYSDPYVGRISYLQVNKSLTPNYNRLASVEFVMRFRYHEKATSAVTFCPQRNIAAPGPIIAACNVAGAMWRDLERRFTILLRNNIVKLAGDTTMLGTSGQNEERILGNLYFFQPIIPEKRR